MNECSTAVRGVCCDKATLTVRGVVSSHFGVANSESEFKILNFGLNKNQRREASHFCLRSSTKCNYTAETRVRYPKSICGICSGQTGTGIDFSPTTLVAPINYHSTYRFPLTVMPLNDP